MSSIEKFIEKIWKSIAAIFKGLLPELQDAVAIGVEAVEAFKKFIDSPAADVVTAFVPGTWDDAAKDWLRSVLPEVLQKLELVKGKLDSADEVIAAGALAYTQIADPDVQKLKLHNMSILLAKKHSDDKITIGQAVATQEYYYRNELQAAK